jgi:uncharacterized membrane protein
MVSLVLRYGTALVVLIALDAAWLSYFAHAVFRPTLGSILLDEPRWIAAGLFYALYALGVVVFAVAPAARDGSWLAALAYGAFLGFVAYMTYDLTNLASIKAWTVTLAIVDTAWGTLATALAAAASYSIATLLSKGG